MALSDVLLQLMSVGTECFRSAFLFESNHCFVLLSICIYILTPIYIFPQQQIDDDENVAETILVEIHADNEESFIDKNVTLTIFKIGESPGTD